MNFRPPPLAWPPGDYFLVFKRVFFENSRRRLVRVLKLHRGLYSQKFRRPVVGFQNFGYEFLAVGEMFEGDSAYTCTGKFPLMSIRDPNGGSSVRRPMSKNPHRRERTFFNLFIGCIVLGLVGYGLSSFFLYIASS